MNNPYFDEELQKTASRQTPFFIFKKELLLNNFDLYKTCMPADTEVCFAMKANSENNVLKLLKAAGSSFEVASTYELDLLKKLGVSPKKIVYGTAIKPISHIIDFVKYGVDRFSFDSEQELMKLAKYAPGSRVYVRALVDDRSESVFSMSEKFGIHIEEATGLLIKAKLLGLIPYGISFNVGSQAKNARSWERGIKDVIKAMHELLKSDIKIEVINIGGGFPHSYLDKGSFPSLGHISIYILNAAKNVPYPVKFIVEPGRAMVANAYVLVTEIIGKNKRSNGHWLYVDAGVYNALMEALGTQGTIRYKVRPVKKNSSKREYYVLTGPTGDNLDVINPHVLLPSSMDIGDRLVIYDTGAYTFTLITPFNGFPKPEVLSF